MRDKNCKFWNWYGGCSLRQGCVCKRILEARNGKESDSG